VHGLLLALGLAGASPVELEWTGEPDCARGHFAASLAAYLGGVQGAEPLRVEVRTQKRARWTLTLTLVGADGRSVRQLHGPSCASVSEAAAFITAVALDPSVLDRAGSPAGSGTPEPPVEATMPADPGAPLVPPAPPEPGAPVAPAVLEPAAAALPSPPEPAEIGRVPEPAPAVRGRPRGPRGFVRVAGGLEALGMPKVGGQVQVAAGPLGRAWRVELRGSYRAPTSASTAENPAVGGRIGLWTVGAHGCGVLRPAVLEVPLCAGVEAGQAVGEGFGFADRQRSRLPWAAITVGGALAWAPRRWLALWLGFELGVPLVRGSFGVGGLGIAHRIGAVSPRAALGIELRFP